MQKKLEDSHSHGVGLQLLEGKPIELDEKAYLTHLCLGCMAYLCRPDLPCPFCGWCAKNNLDWRYPKPGTILDHKFFFGKNISKNEKYDSMKPARSSELYIAWDINNKRKIVIREFFPQFFVIRDNEGEILPCEREDRSFEVDEPTSPLSAKHAREVYAQGKKLFLEDAKNLCQMSDVPGVIKVYDILTDCTDTVYAVTEYINGDTIDEYVKKVGSPITFSKTMQLLSSVFQALDIFYNRNVYHPPLKPSSIMITDVDSKIVDFHDEGYIQYEQMKLGGDFLVPSFNPPEFLGMTSKSMSKQSRSSADVYSLAYIIYYLIAGKPPEYVYNLDDKGTAKPPSELGVNITYSQETTLIKGLARNPEDRYHTVREFYNALTVTQDSDNMTSNIVRGVKKFFFNLWK